MKIEILGTGCAGCKALYETVKQAVNEMEIEAIVVKEENWATIINYNVMSLPGLVIDGKVVASGKKLSVAEVKKLIGQ